MADASTVLLLDSRYRLDKQIASGTFNDIWRGTDLVLARPVAVKLLRPDFSADAHGAGGPGLVRFRTSARHAGLLAHENIARVYDYDEPSWPRPPFLVMEFVDGPSLAAVVADGPLEPARVMHLIAQAAAGLHAVHDAGLVHGDIRPGTLLLESGDTLKVTDFGLSHAAPPGLAAQPDAGPWDRVPPGSISGDVPPDSVRGAVASQNAGPRETVRPDVAVADTTPRSALPEDLCYVAPERVAGELGTPASDLYSLGIVAYQCLTGRVPLRGEPMGAAGPGLTLPPLPELVPAAVARLVGDLTALDPARRPGSAETAHLAAELRDEITAAGAEPAGLRTGPLGIQGAGRRAPRRPSGSLAGGRGVPGAPTASRRTLNRRIMLGAAAAVAAVIALVATGVISPGAHGPAAPASAARLGAGRPRTVQVDGAALRGQPVSAVRAKLHSLGLIVRVRWRASDQLAAGLVLSIQPTGKVPVGSVVVVIGDLGPAGTGSRVAQPGRPGSGVPGHPRTAGPGRSQPAGGPTPGASVTPTATPSPTTSPSATPTASPTSSPAPTTSPTGSAPPSPPPSPSSAPAKTPIPSSPPARTSAPARPSAPAGPSAPAPG